MKSIVFDSGPVISLAMNNLLWILEPMKKKFGGEFFIPTYVEEEIVERPIQTKVFKFEALQVKELIRKEVLKVIYNNEINGMSTHLLELANSSFFSGNTSLKIVQSGEMQAIAAASFFSSDAVVIDERITRMFIEDWRALHRFLENKMKAKISINRKNIEGFILHAQKAKVIRSVELVSVAYELGLLDRFVPESDDGKRQLLDSVLWGVKLKGCSVSNAEIERILKLERV